MKIEVKPYGRYDKCVYYGGRLLIGQCATKHNPRVYADKVVQVDLFTDSSMKEVEDIEKLPYVDKIVFGGKPEITTLTFII
jgi:hypothetical protein